MGGRARVLSDELRQSEGSRRRLRPFSAIVALFGLCGAQKLLFLGNLPNQFQPSFLLGRGAISGVL